MEHDESISVCDQCGAPYPGEDEGAASRGDGVETRLSCRECGADLGARMRAAETPAENREPSLEPEAADTVAPDPSSEPSAAEAPGDVEPPTAKVGSGESESESVPSSVRDEAAAPSAASEPAQTEATVASASGAVSAEAPASENTVEASSASTQAGVSAGAPSEDVVPPSEDVVPPSEDVPTERAPNVEAKLEADRADLSASKLDASSADTPSGDETSEDAPNVDARNAAAEATADPREERADSARERGEERDSVIPIESRDFVADAPARPRRLPKAPARPQAARQGTEWLDELPHSSGTPTLAALVQRTNSESDRPPAPSIPAELLTDRAFDLAASDWEARLLPLVRKPTTDAPVVHGSEAPRATSAKRASTAVVIAAVAIAAFLAGLSVKRPIPELATSEPALRRAAEPIPNIQAAKPTVAVAPPEFAIEPASPEQSPASLPLAEVPAKNAELEATPEGPANTAAPMPNVAAPPVNAAAPLANAAAPAPVSAPSPTQHAVASQAATRAAADGDAKAPRPNSTASQPSEGQPAEPNFDAQAAEAAISAAASRAASCKQPGDPSGVAVVTITFSPSGRATTANVAGEPFAGTATGGCIAATLRGARVPAFSGEFITVKKTVTID